MNKFEEALNDNPEDWSLRLIYADYLEEAGDNVLSNAQRWMAEHKRRPFNNKIWLHIPNCNILSCLPKNVFDYLKNFTKHKSNNTRKDFSSRKDAERSLAEALISSR